MAITFLPTQRILLSIHPFIHMFIFQSYTQLFMMKILSFEFVAHNEKAIPSYRLM